MAIPKKQFNINKTKTNNKPKKNLLYNCREHLKIYQSYNYANQYNSSVITIFKMCHDMKIAYLLI